MLNIEHAKELLSTINACLKSYRESRTLTQQAYALFAGEPAMIRGLQDYKELMTLALEAAQHVGAREVYVGEVYEQIIDVYSFVKLYSEGSEIAFIKPLHDLMAPTLTMYQGFAALERSRREQIIALCANNLILEIHWGWHLSKESKNEFFLTLLHMAGDETWPGYCFENEVLNRFASLTSFSSDRSSRLASPELLTALMTYPTQIEYLASALRALYRLSFNGWSPSYAVDDFIHLITVAKINGPEHAYLLGEVLSSAVTSHRDDRGPGPRLIKAIIGSDTETLSQLINLLDIRDDLLTSALKGYSGEAINENLIKFCTNKDYRISVMRAVGVIDREIPLIHRKFDCIRRVLAENREPDSVYIVDLITSGQTAVSFEDLLDEQYLDHALLATAKEKLNDLRKLPILALSAKLKRITLYRQLKKMTNMLNEAMNARCKFFEDRVVRVKAGEDPSVVSYQAEVRTMVELFAGLSDPRTEPPIAPIIDSEMGSSAARISPTASGGAGASVYSSGLSAAGAGAGRTADAGAGGADDDIAACDENPAPDLAKKMGGGRR